MFKLITEVVAHEFIAFENEIAWLLAAFDRKRAVERRVRNVRVA